MVPSRNLIAKNRIRDMEANHVALDSYLSLGGVGSSGIWFWGNCRSFSRNRQNFVLYLFDPLRGLASEWPYPKGVR
jgi:hypothetical protein